MYTKVALVYDRVNKWGGAERVLLALHEIFPKAPLYTAVYSRKNAKWAKVFPKVITTFLGRLPMLQDKHELLGSFTPFAFEQVDLSEYDLVVSVTSEAAKGIITGVKTKHICYMLTPTRYLWSGFEEYFRNKVLKWLSNPIVNYLKWWDIYAARRPDKIVAISNAVRRRIKKYYYLPSTVIFPPVNVNIKKKDLKVMAKRKNYYLMVGRFVPYKKFDLAIETFNKLGLPLYIVGTGSDGLRLFTLAKKNITFLGEVSEEKLKKLYMECKAFIFPQEEDFGIVSVEAQAYGAPVIAFKAGGALDTVKNNVTGILFPRQEVDSLAQAIAQFNNQTFSQRRLLANAKRFSKERFIKEFKKLVDGRL
jgi:glycosyltransferase involved in cell wall biosynthesis